ncbi:B- and T-lymphocyte attenuator-like isoform X2 [Labrus mixtus]|uniref:B- and T-lymphocyte attenuator-like isoform X2 n=1 Tax=Labrus mixtus TaxID=508554 RepID=UPI0029C0FB6C|nr:B- and T-lymphocyte attenuator-like isoform X2 [Labrus mixtus]
MRPNTCWTRLHVSVLAVLLLILEADSTDECEVQIKVRSKTKYEALLGEELKIECPVTFCNDSPPEVSWVKLEETGDPVNIIRGSLFGSEWKTITPLKGISVLIIQNFVRNDSGIYRCKSGSSVGHNINVYLNDGTFTDAEFPEDLWMYMYTAAGIVAFVLFVIIVSVASMRGCKGKAKNERREDNQYMAIPMAEQPFPNPHIQPSPRGSPSLPLPQRSMRRKTPPPQPIEPPPPRDIECVYSKVNVDRDQQRNTLEENGSSVVYAALNHQLPARPVARPRRQKEECSEYAAIRVRDSSS